MTNEEKQKEERQKEITKFQQSKGQLLASIEKVEDYLSLEDFKDYCDAIYTAVAYQDTILKLVKSPDKQGDVSGSNNIEN